MRTPVTVLPADWEGVPGVGLFSVTSRGTTNGDLVTTDLSGAAFSEAVKALHASANDL